MKRDSITLNKGITLIALVITIIVLLILAGVTIATLMGDNGILTKATEAKNDQADGTVKEAVALLWNEYQLEIKSSSNEGVKESTKIASTEITKIQGEEANYLATTATSFWDFLLTDKQVINGDGIVDVQKLTGQTLDRGNGTDGVTDVYKIERDEETNEYTLRYCVKAGEEENIWNVTETSTNGVNIIISQTGTLLKVENVEGLDKIDLNSISIDKLGEDEKKELVKKIDLYGYNNIGGKNYQDFNELLKDLVNGNEQKYWEEIGDVDNYLKNRIDGFIDSGIESLPTYIVINPDGEVSDTYRAYANDTYTFTVKEIDTGKTYTKSVQITNIEAYVKELTIYLPYSEEESVTIQYVEGMTWDDWFESQYYSVPEMKINSSGNIFYTENATLEDENGILYSDEKISSEHQYHFVIPV